MICKPLNSKLYFSYAVFISFLLINYSCNQTAKIKKFDLSVELDSILKRDQKHRQQLTNLSEQGEGDNERARTIWVKQDSLDSINLKSVIEIINKIGKYPGKSMVGVSSSVSVFYVLQHSPDSIHKRYLKLIRTAADEDELDKSYYAKYLDRHLMHQGKPQIYGTQIRIDFEIDSLSGKRKTRNYLWPIADTTGIDSLRRLNNLGPLEAYLWEQGLSRWED